MNIHFVFCLAGVINLFLSLHSLSSQTGLAAVFMLGKLLLILCSHSSFLFVRHKPSCTVLAKSEMLGVIRIGCSLRTGVDEGVPWQGSHQRGKWCSDHQPSLYTLQLLSSILRGSHPRQQLLRERGNGS